MKHIIGALKKSVSPAFWLETAKKLKKNIPLMVRDTYMSVSFFVLLIAFLCGKIWSFFMKIPLIGIVFRKIHGVYMAHFNRFYEGMVSKIEKTRTTQLKRSYLISLAYKNLMVKKTRSFITILGMSVGVGIIVFLLSLGYGLERLIISRVAGLDELKMIDVSTGTNTSLRLNSKATDKIKKMQKVDKVIPLISLVGRVSYNNANTDTVVYAAPKSYLEVTKLKLIKGSYFTSTSAFLPESSGQVAGAEAEMKKGSYLRLIRAVELNAKPEIAPTVWSSCDTDSKFIGYTVRQEGGYEGEEYWGGEYAPFNTMGRNAYDEKRSQYLGLWVKAHVPVFSKDAQGALVPQLDDMGRQKWETLCMQEKDLQIFPKQYFGQVLGESTSSAELEESSPSGQLTGQTPEATESASLFDAVVVASSEGGLEVVQLQASGSAATAKKTSDTLKLNMPSSGEAVVSLGFLRLLNIPENKAIGRSFKVQFIVVKNLMPEIEGRVLTSQVEYRIKGVTDDAESQYIYIPFTDAQLIGIKNFSQVKVVFANQTAISNVRKEIETMGFKTNSTVDTIAQIESLFANLRVLLGLLGMVALGVASLGMFNTLTVSLLERTREIGGMKTMGVVSDEIQDLFLAEAMIMGLGGGVGGLVMGTLVGKALSLGISAIAIVSGQGYLSLTYVPPYLVFFILLSSFIVGMITGFYPAQRAKKISALNALRYE